MDFFLFPTGTDVNAIRVGKWKSLNKLPYYSLITFALNTVSPSAITSKI